METPSHERPRSTPSRTDMHCCDDAHCASGRRNRFFAGKRMTPDSLRVEQRYHVERRRLINRAMHGWGVVYGFPMHAGAPDACGGDGERRLHIGGGLAFDACGRELVQVGDLALDLSDVLAFDKAGRFLPPAREGCRGRDASSPWDGDEATCWLLSAHYTERPLSPVEVRDPCNCEGREWDHVCETIVYSLKRIDCAGCCAPDTCSLKCRCATGPCCDEHVAPKDPKNPKGPKDPAYERPRDPQAIRDLPLRNTDGLVEAPLRDPHVVLDAQARPSNVVRDPHARDQKHDDDLPPLKRGGCRCLCEHLATLEVGACDCDTLCDIGCGRRASPHGGVPLACVRLVRDRCGDWTFGEVADDCGPRRLVKRNDLLFDLIRGCDLTRISQTGWEDWHRRGGSVDWQQFSDSFGPLQKNGCVSDVYKVRFSRPVRASTVRSDCFAMTVVGVEEEGGWGEPWRARIVRVEGDVDGPLWREVRLVFAYGWVKDAIRGEGTIFNHHQARVEIEVRGDFILDCNGQAVDANAIGRSPAPTGNGTPGGTYLSTFRVGPRPPDAELPDEDETDTTTGGAP